LCKVKPNIPTGGPVGWQHGGTRKLLNPLVFWNIEHGIDPNGKVDYSGGNAVLGRGGKTGGVINRIETLMVC
jgi:hypothetical protein